MSSGLTTWFPMIRQKIDALSLIHEIAYGKKIVMPAAQVVYKDKATDRMYCIHTCDYGAGSVGFFEFFFENDEKKIVDRNMVITQFLTTFRDLEVVPSNVDVERGK